MLLDQCLEFIIVFFLDLISGGFMAILYLSFFFVTYSFVELANISETQ